MGGIPGSGFLPPNSSLDMTRSHVPSHSHFHLFVWPNASWGRGLLGVKDKAGIIEWLGLILPGNDFAVLTSIPPGPGYPCGEDSSLHDLKHLGEEKNHSSMYLTETYNSYGLNIEQADRFFKWCLCNSLGHHEISMHRMTVESQPIL